MIDLQKVLFVMGYLAVCMVVGVILYRVFDPDADSPIVLLSVFWPATVLLTICFFVIVGPALFVNWLFDKWEG